MSKVGREKVRKERKRKGKEGTVECGKVASKAALFGKENFG